MALTKTPIELSSTPSIVDGGNATAITIDSSENVGIGTSSPSAPLNISATYASDTTEQLRIQDNTGGKLDFFGYANGGKGIQAYADDGSTFYNLNLNPLGGNVGIGTTSPTANTILHMKDTATQIELENTNGSNSAFIDFDGNNLQLSTNRNMIDGAFSNTGKSAAGIFMSGPSGGSHIVLSTASANNTVPTERMRIDSSGNVGIGTGSVTNNTNRTTLGLQGAWGGQLDIMVGSTVHAQIGSDNFSSGQSCRIQSQDGIVFRAGGSSERMRILSTGGITFNGDTAAANALDDYEEGTFTPTVTTSSGSISYAAQQGGYVKVGDAVHYWIRLVATCTATATLYNLSLPFSTSGYNAFYAGPTVGNAYNVTLGSGGTVLGGYYINGNNAIRLHSYGSNTGQLAPSCSANQGFEVRMEGSYRLSS